MIYRDVQFLFSRLCVLHLRLMSQLSISADIFVYIRHSKRKSDATHNVNKAARAYRFEYQSC